MNFVKRLKSDNDFASQIEQHTTVFDKWHKFLYFVNRKAASQSILRTVLKSRKIYWDYKSDLDREQVIEYCERYDPYIFTIVRNPWDRVVSSYSFLAQNGSKYHKVLRKGMSFPQFVKKVIYKKGPTFDVHIEYQHTSAFCGNERFADFVGKLESIDVWWADLSEAIGNKNKLVHRNRSNRKAYREYYNNETKNIIADIYEKDIELFGYEFE